jgi:hypothetical protein
VTLTPDQETQALVFCHQAITDLRSEVEKYADVDSGGRMRKWRRGLKIAFGKEEIRKQVETLRSAKTHLIDARTLYVASSVVLCWG